MIFENHLVAHRGYPARLPENTLPSVEGAIEAGARFVEVDIQLSKDKIPVIFHDRTLERLCGLPGAIHDYPASQLQSFHVRDRFGVTSKNITIPRLFELVELIQTFPDINVFIEIKRASLEHYGIEKMMQVVLKELEPASKQCVIISYSIEALNYVKQVSAYPVGAVFDNWSDHKRPDIQALEPEYLFCDIKSLPEGEVVVPGNSRLAVYDCLDPELARSVLHRGVDLVETFAIGEMLSLLNQTGGSVGS